MVPEGTVWRDDGLLCSIQFKTEQSHLTLDVFTWSLSGGPGEFWVLTAPLSQLPAFHQILMGRDSLSHRFQVPGASGDKSVGQSLTQQKGFPAVPCRPGDSRCAGGGARVALGNQTGPGPKSSVLQGCSRLTFAGGFCALACEGRWSKNGPRPRGHEPSD